MDNIVYAAISLAVAAAAHRMFSYAAGSLSLKYFNVFSWVYYVQLILFCFIGVNIVVMGYSSHDLISKLPDHELYILVYGSVCYTILAMPAGMIFTMLLFNISSQALRRELLRYHLKWEKYAPVNDMAVLSIFALAAVLCVVYTYTELKSVSWLYLFAGLDGDALLSRVSAARAFPGNEYIKNIMAIALTPVLCYASYCYKKKLRSRYAAFLFCVTFISSVFILIYNAEKGPILEFFLGFLLLKVLTEGSISRKYAVFLVGLVILCIAGMYLILGMDSGFLSIDSGPLGRILQSQIAGLYYHIYLFPDVFDFLYGAGLPSSLGSLLGYSQHISSGRLVMEYVNAKGVSAGMAGVVNTLFIGEAWANFGWAGLAAAPFVVGIYIETAYIIFMRYFPKNPLFAGFYTYFSMNLPITGGFLDLLYNPVVIAVFFIILFMNYINNVFIYRQGDDDKRQNI